VPNPARALTQESRLEVLRPADEEQARRRLEDLLEKVGPAGASANAAELRNISRRALCFSKNFGVIFVPPSMWIALCCLSLFCRVL